MFKQMGACLAAFLAAAPLAQVQTAAASESAAGDRVVRLAPAGVLPLASGRHIDAPGGDVAVTATPAPEAGLTYFLTDAISIPAIAASTRHEIGATDTILSGTRVTADPYARLSGVLVFLNKVHESQHSLAEMGRVIRKVGLSNAVGPVFKAGLNHHLYGPWS